MPLKKPYENNRTKFFVQLNEKKFDELLTFLDFSEGFTIGFAEINFPKDVDLLIDAVKKHPKTQGIQFEVLDFSEPNLKFLKDAILQRLSEIKINEDKKLVFIIRGLENSIGMIDDFPPMLQDLNFVRDAFAEKVPYPLLFCLPDYAITRLAKYAPDFWAWKSGLFHFDATEPIMRLRTKQMHRLKLEKF